MPHQHFLIPRLVTFGRHAAGLGQVLLQPVEIGVTRLRALLGRKAGPGDRSDSAGSSDSRPLPLLIHFHIFKNAGTSFEWALEQAFKSGYRSLDSSSPSGFISNRDLTEFSDHNPSAQAISSHQATPPAPTIRGREMLTSILIRDPIARIRSIYSFERSRQVDLVACLARAAPWAISISPRCS